MPQNANGFNLKRLRDGYGKERIISEIANSPESKARGKVLQGLVQKINKEMVVDGVS